MSKTQQIIETPVAGVFPEPVGEMQRRSSWLSNKFTENSCNGANENMNIWVPNYLKWRKFEREMKITQDCGKHSLGEGVKALGCSSLNCGRVKRGVSGSFNFLCSYWQLLLVHSYQIMLFVAVLQLLVGSNVRGSPSASSKVKLYICKQHTVQFLPEFQKEVTNATLITEQSIMCTAGAQQASIKSKIVNLRVDTGFT